MLTSILEMKRLGMLDAPSVIFIILSFAAMVLVMLPMHEFAHAFVADRLGDPTPRQNGRLSLNPFHHLDWFGTLMLLTVGFGYARPVPVNPRNFRSKSPQTGMALTAAAGPVANLLMAAVSLLLFRLIGLLTGEAVTLQNGYVYVTSRGIYYVYLVLVQVFASVNLGLAVFNLLPIPPLDGSRILMRFLPQRLQYRVMQYEQYITIAVFVLLLAGVLDVPLSFLRSGIGWVLCALMGLPNYFG